MKKIEHLSERKIHQKNAIEIATFNFPSLNVEMTTEEYMLYYEAVMVLEANIEEFKSKMNTKKKSLNC